MELFSMHVKSRLTKHANRVTWSSSQVACLCPATALQQQTRSCMRSLLPKLQTLKRAQLQQIAIHCGINSGGTKAVLAPRVDDELIRVETNDHDSKNGGRRRGARKKEERESPPRRILSIDMGIRNLAYCVFDVATPAQEKSSQGASSAAAKVTLRSWKRIAVAPRLEKTAASNGAGKESFEPIKYASYAYDFLSEVVRAHSPTHILIERQRYRTFGSSAVLEWTVRVNMFEAMLHAVLRTLMGESKWTGTVQAMSPSKVAAFWLPSLSMHDAEDQGHNSKTKRRIGREKGLDGGKAKPNGKNNKVGKIGLVARWLKAKDVVDLATPEAQNTADAFLNKYDGKGIRRRRKTTKTQDEAMVKITKGDEEENGETLLKLDDLADCLLQGITFLRWEDNRRRIVREMTSTSTSMSRSAAAS